MKIKPFILLPVLFLLLACSGKKEVTGIAISEKTLTLYVGETSTLSATVSPSGVAAEISWRSLREQVARVENGTVTAIAPGMTEVIATAGGFSAGCRVTVLKVPVPVTGVTLSEQQLYLQPSGTAQLTATVLPLDADHPEVTWTSSDETVASVVDGFVSAFQEGEADITVKTTEGGFTATCHLIVRTIIPVSSVTLSKDLMSVFVGVPAALQWTVLPQNATDKSVTWHSSDESVFTVSDGVVTGHKEGIATLTVRTVDGGYEAACRITVILPGTTVGGGGFEDFNKEPSEWDPQN